MTDSLGHKATTGALWAAIDKFGSMGLQFIVNIILARILLPSDFGVIGMLAIFIAVSNTLIDGGFGSALIQKKEPTQIDYSTIFYWNILFSSFLYIVLYVCAPLVAEFYKMPLLSDVLKCIGLTIIIGSITSIQSTRLKKTLSFKTLAIVNIISYALSASFGVLLAFNNFGVWSLVYMTIVNGVIMLILLWSITRWHPSITFSIRSMRELFGFGGYILAANILQNICNNIQGIIIGKRFSATQMGYYSQAYKLDQIPSTSIPQVIVQVMYPVYSSLQDDESRLISILSMNIRVISFLIYPLLGLLILLAPDLIEFLYGVKWIPASPYFQILCVGGLFVALQNVNFYAVASKGKSKPLFYWSFYKWGFLIASILFGSSWGIFGLLWGMVISNINIYLVNAFLVGKYVGLSTVNQIKLLFPVFMVLALSLASSYIFVTLINVSYGRLWGSLIFIIVFGLGSLFFNKISVKETFAVIRQIFKAKNKD